MAAIAVFLPNWVGDVVMATPAIRALRQRYANSHLLGICRPYVADVLSGNPWFDQLFLSKKASLGNGGLVPIIRALRSQPIDLAVLLPNSLRSAFAAWLGGCRVRVGYAWHGRGALLTRSLNPRRDHRGRRQPSPIIDAYNRLAQAAGAADPGYQMELFTPRWDQEEADRVWRTAGWAPTTEVVGINPGAAYGAAKFWPMEYWVTLAQQLVDTRGCGLLVLCGPKEQDLARHIVAQVQRPGVHTLAAHRISLGLTKACVQRLALLVTTDSGPRHFGTAFDRPVLTLFGPTHIAWTETYHPRSINLQQSVPCGPCQLRVCPLDHRCMRELTPQAVFEQCYRLLQRYPWQQETFRHAG